MNVFAVQLDIVWEDKRANFERVRKLLQRTPPAIGSLIVLPEMFATGFSMNLGVTRQDQQREDELFLKEIAREYRSTVLGGVVSSGDDDDLGRNQSVAFSPDGELLARYTKIHPFTLGGESSCHARGSEVVVFAAHGFHVAPFVCYDLRFPEIFRAAAMRGANLLVVIALWPVKRQQHWLTLLQARAIENQAFVVGVNRVGTEPQFHYAGRSVVIDPHGIIVADAGEREGILTAEIDVEKAEAWRRDFPALRDAHWHPAEPASKVR
ncbi:MAG TPA: carbon-nitrogen family hydrolase [Chthoniobacteraceae bacterium]|nr:carbon-nitrogen family hydrolase [Chthoniobacteraceae bacterium]